MKMSKPTKSNDQAVIIKMISRDEELERNQGKFVSKDRPYVNKKKYHRHLQKDGLRKELSSHFSLYKTYVFQKIVVSLYYKPI